MSKSRDVLSQQVLKLVMAGIAVSCLGAAVVAAPLSIAPRHVISADGSQATATKTAFVPAAFAPLASGPALKLSPAAAGEDEDCVRVTAMTGPDGQVYPTRGLVCSQ